MAELSIEFPEGSGLEALDGYSDRVAESAASLGDALAKARLHDWETETMVAADLDDSDLNMARASSNCYVKRAEEARKDFRRTWMELYDEVDRRYRIEMGPHMDWQAELKDEWRRRRDEWRRERAETLEDEYRTYSPFLAERIPFERVCDPEWLLKRTEYPKAVEALHAKCRRMASDIGELQSQGLEYEEDALGEYFESLDVRSAFERNDELAARKRAAAEMEGEQAEVEERREWTVRCTGTRRQLDRALAAMHHCGLTHIEEEGS